MAIKITKNGIKTLPGLSRYIGMEADFAKQQIVKDLSYKTTSDCFGRNGYRNITMVGMEKRIEILCESEKRNEVVNEGISPSETKWIILDIFEYSDRPIVSRDSIKCG